MGGGHQGEASLSRLRAVHLHHARKAEVHDGGEEYDLGPGDVIHVPANEVHAAEIIEEVEAIYVKDTTWSLKGVAAGEAAPDAPPADDPF